MLCYIFSRPSLTDYGQVRPPYDSLVVLEVHPAPVQAGVAAGQPLYLQDGPASRGHGEGVA